MALNSGNQVCTFEKTDMTVETGIDGMYARLNDANHKKPQTELADANYSELDGVSIASNLAFETVLLFCFLLQAPLLCNEVLYHS